MASGCVSKFLWHINKQLLSTNRLPFLFKITRQKYNLAKEPFAIIYSQTGDPRTVLETKKLELPSELQKDEVLVKMLMAPINPADINMIEGTYHFIPPLPAVVGNEGVGEVLDVGNEVKNLQQGDWVIPNDAGWGTWRTHGVTKESEVQVIPNDMPMLSAATIAVNPCTAYRMLKDFVHLQRGDVIIQNGANSAVGQAVIQLARHWKIQTINIIRNRPEIDDFVHFLKDLGGTYVVTEEFCRTPEMKELIKSLSSPPRLALNCTGGKSATELLRHLGPGGVMVTYGGMAKQPVTVPTGVMLFKEVKLAGYWNTLWNRRNKDTLERTQMLNELCEMAKECQLLPPVSDLVPISNFKEAVSASMEGYRGHKNVLVMEDSLIMYPESVDM